MDPVKQKEYFHQAVDMLKNMAGPSTPTIAELSLDQGHQYNNAFKGPSRDMEHTGKSAKITHLWLHLFSDILEDEQLTSY